MVNILVADDDPVIQRVATDTLTMEGYEVTTAKNGQDCLRSITSSQPDLVILDVTMPDMTGFEVCNRIRADPYTANLPIIFLTANNRPHDIAQGLDVGGDDYLSKDAIRIELPARVRALLRRIDGGQLHSSNKEITTNDLIVDKVLPIVSRGGKQIKLTAIEHRLLYILMANEGVPVSNDHLLETVWEYPPGTGDPKLVRTHIGNLRAKIEPTDQDAPRYIHNIRGKGYMFAG